VLLILSIVLLALFVLWEARLERLKLSPLVKVSLFARANGKISVILAALAFMWISAPGYVYLETIYFQSYQGLGPLQGAIRFLPATIVGLFACVRLSFLWQETWLIRVACPNTACIESEDPHPVLDGRSVYWVSHALHKPLFHR
jgi:hypothetical protein